MVDRRQCQRRLSAGSACRHPRAPARLRPDPDPPGRADRGQGLQPRSEPRHVDPLRHQGNLPQEGPSADPPPTTGQPRRSPVCVRSHDLSMPRRRLARLQPPQEVAQTGLDLRQDRPEPPRLALRWPASCSGSSDDPSGDTAETGSSAEGSPSPRDPSV